MVHIKLVSYVFAELHFEMYYMRVFSEPLVFFVLCVTGICFNFLQVSGSRMYRLI
jgi:hypothetical protein